MAQKFLLPLTCLMLAVTSCTNDTVLERNDNESGRSPIRFNPIVNNVSRGGGGTEFTAFTSDDVHDAFIVRAYGNVGYYIDNEWAYIDEDYTFGESEAPEFYWPDYNLSFNALAPVDYSDPKDGHTFVRIEGENGNDYFESTSSHFRSAVDVIVARSANQGYEVEKRVELSFKHIYSQLIINVRNVSEYYNVKIRKVALRYIPTQAKYYFADNSWEAPKGNIPDTGIAKDDDDTKDYVGCYEYDLSKDNEFSREGYVDLTSVSETVTIIGNAKKNGYDNTTYSNGVYLIPQNLTESAWNGEKGCYGAYLALYVNITADSTDGAEHDSHIFPAHADENGEMYGWVAIKLFSNNFFNNLQAGKRYIVTLDISESSLGVYPPDDEERGGDPILHSDAPVKFTVTEINGFTNSTTQDEEDLNQHPQGNE